MHINDFPFPYALMKKPTNTVCIWVNFLQVSRRYPVKLRLKLLVVIMNQQKKYKTSVEVGYIFYS